MAERVTAGGRSTADASGVRGPGRPRRRSPSGVPAGQSPGRSGGTRSRFTADVLRAVPGGADGVATSLDAVLAVARSVCPSCVAVSLTLGHQGRSTTVTATTDPACTRAASMSFRAPAAVADGVEPGSAVLHVFATDPLALARLAADVAPGDTQQFRVTLRPTARVPPPSSADVVGSRELADRTTVDRALGALLEQGWSPDEGRRELQHRADTTGSPLVCAAAVVLANLPGAPSRRPPTPGGQADVAGAPLVRGRRARAPTM